ncbi:hypothetical protein BHE90_000078 [Fusarium euwallaceae]|uniref:Uncharacterized protein n=2 Tax=Fusarium solani species complex TaxID=232080 RepID=A0A430MBJ2_9HYPO|nr:hypothetical protein CEP51_009790 [Fusarium floridanum]RTE85325.1 hypothetical protein BHE90_000078 [Fusarium euwallaceae]
MSEQEIPADYDIGWQDATSSNGKTYRIKADDYDIADKPEDEDSLVSASGPKFSGVAVNWEVGTSGNTDDETRDRTAIIWYKLEKAPIYSLHQWRLTISCEDTYNFRFFDEEPDYYDLDVWLTSGTHWVEYDSENPTIISISSV